MDFECISYYYLLLFDTTRNVLVLTPISTLPASRSNFELEARRSNDPRPAWTVQVNLALIGSTGVPGGR